jgi:hypothetical protein
MRVCMCVFDLQPGPGFMCYFCAHFLFLCFYYSTILLSSISRFWSCLAFVHYFNSLQFLDLKARLCSCVSKRSKSFVCFNFLVEVSF